MMGLTLVFFHVASTMYHDKRNNSIPVTSLATFIQRFSEMTRHIWKDLMKENFRKIKSWETKSTTS